MKARLAALPPRALLAIAVGAVLVYALVVWFLVVSPKRAEATTLSDDVVAAELRLADARATASRPHAADRHARLRRLPAREGDAGEHRPAGPRCSSSSCLARATGVTLGSITLQEPVIERGRPDGDPGRRHRRGVVSPDHAVPQATHVSSYVFEAARFARQGGSSRCRASSSPSRRRTGSRASTRRSRSTRTSTTGPIVPVDAARHADRATTTSTGATAAGANPVTPEARAARERKQKIFVVVGGLLLARACSPSSCRSCSAARRPRLQRPRRDDDASGQRSIRRRYDARSATSRAATPVAARRDPGRSRRSPSFALKDPFVQQVVTDSGLGAAEGAGKAATEKAATAETPRRSSRPARPRPPP